MVNSEQLAGSIGRNLIPYSGGEKTGRAEVAERRSSRSDLASGWIMSHSSIAEYGSTFRPVLDQGLIEYVRERVSLDGYRSSIDLMASEEAVADCVNLLGYEAGVAVSLGMPHEKHWDEVLGDGAISMVNGNIAVRQTWKDIRGKMHDITPGGFDLVLSRGEAGLRSQFLPANTGFYFLLLQRIWSISARRSTLLIQVPRSWLNNTLEYLSLLKQRGIEVHLPSDWEDVTSLDGYPVRIERRPANPTRLPLPKLLCMK